MIFVTVQRNLTTEQMTEGTIAPVIRVRMRQENGMNVGPRALDGAESLSELPWAKTGVEQHAKAVRLNERCIAAAAACQDREPQTHAVSFIADTLRLGSCYGNSGSPTNEDESWRFCNVRC